MLLKKQNKQIYATPFIIDLFVNHYCVKIFAWIIKQGQKVVHKNVSQGCNLSKDCDVLKNRKTSP